MISLSTIAGGTPSLALRAKIPSSRDRQTELVEVADARLSGEPSDGVGDPDRGMVERCRDEVALMLPLLLAKHDVRRVRA